MDYKIFDNLIYARFDKDDEVIESIAKICKRENISSASFSGIGGCGDVTVGTFDYDKQDYILQNQKGLLEMLSLNGNVTLNDKNEPFVHAHAMFSYIDEKGNHALMGGHLKKAIISLTGEIVISPIKNGIIKRKRNEDLGISIWQF